MTHSFAVLVFSLSVLSTSAFAADDFEQRKITGKDSVLVAKAMKNAGAAIVPFAPDTSSDHPVVEGMSERVYRMESVVCREKNCEGFKSTAAELKKLDQIFRKLGVKETRPPAAPKGKSGKPYIFIQELLCAVEKDLTTPTTCFVSAHFKSP